MLLLDDALIPQARLRQVVCAGEGLVLDYRDLGPALRLWSRPAPLERLRKRLVHALPAGSGPAVVFAGSGDFHHVTPVLLERAVAAAGGPPVTLVHFDNHPDWVKFGPGAHCGSWVSLAARMPQVVRVLTIGVCSNDIRPAAARNADLSAVADGRLELYAYGAGPTERTFAVAGRQWPTIEGVGAWAFAHYLPGRIETEAVYITIDKDVLRPEEAGTNWDQGRMTAALLEEFLVAATRGRRLIGADVVGDWSRPRYGGGLGAGLLKRGEAALDQPWRSPSHEALARNEAINLMLLRLLREAGA